MARSRLPTARPSLTFGSWLSHYLPAWTALFLVVLPILFGNAVRTNQMPDSQPALWPADVSLGMLSFWIGALVTNAHDSRLVRSSGRRVARNARQKREEFAVILFFLTLTLVSYVFCNMGIPSWSAAAVATASMMAPVFVLRSPEP